ncbi:hypothetical protein KSC_087920 [Ktedonobacter sp. SOSP1-52]|nr:hypothetical protein KSC_087920 [Ktedonobacter sp. SOSP1-52]
MLAGKLLVFINVGKALLIVVCGLAHLAFFQSCKAQISISNFTQVAACPKAVKGKIRVHATGQYQMHMRRQMLIQKVRDV